MLSLLGLKQKEVKRGPKFRLGDVGISSKALSILKPKDIYVALRRHAFGDWGEIEDEAKEENEESVKIGGDIYSVYHSECDIEFWIITNGDRSATTIILPEQHQSFRKYQTSLI